MNGLGERAKKPRRTAEQRAKSEGITEQRKAEELNSQRTAKSLCERANSEQPKNETAAIELNEAIDRGAVTKRQSKSAK